MKRLIIICSALAIINSVYGQAAGMYSGKWEENENSRHKITEKQPNEFENTEMSYSQKTATFSNLPDLKKPVFAVITNSTGEFVKQKKVNAEDNYVNVDKLSPGLYYVTLVFRQKGKRAYVLNIK